MLRLELLLLWVLLVLLLWVLVLRSLLQVLLLRNLLRLVYSSAATILGLGLGVHPLTLAFSLELLLEPSELLTKYVQLTSPLRLERLGVDSEAVAELLDRESAAAEDWLVDVEAGGSFARSCDTLLVAAAEQLSVECRGAGRIWREQGDGQLLDRAADSVITNLLSPTLCSLSK